VYSGFTHLAKTDSPVIKEGCAEVSNKMKSLALILLAAAASAVTLESEQYVASVLPEQKTAVGYSVGSFVQSGTGAYEPVRKEARQKGRFVDLCPNAGKCDFSPDQKIGGEIINLDTAEIEKNLAAANLGVSDYQQNLRYEALQRSKIAEAALVNPVEFRNFSTVQMPTLGAW
jgi:hypothetical protein